MLVHRRRRWITIKATLDLRVLNIYSEKRFVQEKTVKKYYSIHVNVKQLHFCKGRKKRKLHSAGF